jgi:predicted SnoaL-like aldol condensation-catalyzing enzyme
MTIRNRAAAPTALVMVLVTAFLAPSSFATDQETRVPAVATTETVAVRNLRVVPPPSARAASAQEEANKRIVLQWHYEFFDLGQFESASNKYMAEDFQQNDPREPSGRANYVNNFKGNGYVAKKPEERPPLIAVLADGDLVMTVIPEGWDGKSKARADAGPIHCNMYRVVNGRIRAMWVSGGGGAPMPATTSAPPAR